MFLKYKGCLCHSAEGRPTFFFTFSQYLVSRTSRVCKANEMITWNQSGSLPPSAVEVLVLDESSASRFLGWV